MWHLFCWLLNCFGKVEEKKIYKFSESRKTGGNLRVFRRCYYNICFTALRPFLSMRCSWHYPCSAHWLTEVKSTACTKANGNDQNHQSQQLSWFLLCPQNRSYPKCLTLLRRELVWLPTAAAPWVHSSCMAAYIHLHSQSSSTLPCFTFPPCSFLLFYKAL